MSGAALRRARPAPDRDEDRSGERTRRKHRLAPIARPGASNVGAGETMISELPAFPNCDFVLDPKSDAALASAIVRLYAVYAEVATLEAQLTIIDNTKPIRLSAVGRGCDTWQARIVLAAAVPGATVVNIPSMLTTFADGSNTIAGGLGAGAVAGVSSFYNGPLAAGAFPASGIIKATPGNLLDFWGTNEGAAQRWIHVFDAAAIPANGATPKYRFDVPSKAPFTLTLTDPQDAWPPGAPFTVGMCWAISSTGPTLTIDAAGLADVYAKFV